MSSHPDLDPALFTPLLNRVDELHEKVTGDFFKPEPNSSLDMDDVAVRPLHFSSVPRWCLISAIDHVRTVGQLIIRSPRMPMVATASLMRSAIETGSAAIFFLSPEGRQDRLRRYFDEERAQQSEAADVIGLFGGSFDLQAAEALLRRAVDNFPLTGPYGSLRTRVSIAARIREAEPVVERFAQRGRAVGVIEGWWRLLSGITHGRRYAWQLALSRIENSYDEESEVVDADVAFDSPRVVAGMSVALDVIESGVHLYGVRARKFTRVQEDDEFLATLIQSGLRKRE